MIDNHGNAFVDISSPQATKLISVATGQDRHGDRDDKGASVSATVRKLCKHRMDVTVELRTLTCKDSLARDTRKTMTKNLLQRRRHLSTHVIKCVSSND